ncbi:MAG TPA: glycosyltransferase [Cytophagales bacterium]|nr:glycosyltransferase [Cytophagales bacterium]HAA19579.1 glycosyltransferase [Cytophagales bacterium]HAP58754.1 glycosyltransferase [Cytophagales bacterium]
MEDRPHISIVSPVYRAENLIELLVDRTEATLKGMGVSYEIILVEDGGPDNSWDKIVEVQKTHPAVRGIQLSRNFGQHYAITAGLDATRGEWVVVMDCDLQDQPEEIPKLYAKAQEGYEAVLASRVERQDTFFKRLFSKLFYRTLGYLTGSKQDPSVANFGIYHRKVIQAITSMRENIRYFPTMVRWVGFRQTTLPVEHAPRAEGKTTYNYRRLFMLALDIILANSDKPIRLTIRLGFYISVAAFLFILITLYKYFADSIVVPGYASIIISIWFFSGLFLSSLGMIGLYLGKTFTQAKNRPVYIVGNTTPDPTHET